MSRRHTSVSGLRSSIARALSGGRRGRDGAAQSIPARFERVAARRRAERAIGSGAWQPTYAELNAAANRLAHRLLAHGGMPEDRVALLMRHDAPLVAASLGVLKAGRVVTVLNPTEPPARIQQVLADAEPALIVSDAWNGDLAARIAASAQRVIHVEECADAPTHDPGLRIDPDRLAWLLFTSGSTGRPKGVVQTHRNILHNVHRLSLGMALRPEDRVVLLSSPSGGQGLSTTFCALLGGSRLCPFPAAERGVTGLADWMGRHGITVFISSASLFRHFAKALPPDRRFPEVRVVRLASEVATSADFEAFQRYFTDECFLLNTLSSSETGNIAQHRLSRSDRVPDGRLPVGRACEGIEIRLLDENQQEVPPGEIGEIAVRSRYLSPGYWRDESLTAERFSNGERPGDPRVFRSGDLARRSADGVLTFAGRKDMQVKIRGFRVELSAVEEALAEQPGIDRAAVCARAGRDDDAQLVAYVVLREGQPRSAEALRASLRTALPSHMVPSAFVFLDRLPATPHGKVDRAQLRSIRPEPTSTPPPEEPVTDTEALIASIWREVFDRDAVGRRDDFFDLGGDSLSAAVVAARVHAALEVELDLRAFAEHPTLRELALAVDALGAAGGRGCAPVIARTSRATPLPLSFEQERIFAHCRTPEGCAAYTMAFAHRIQGPLDVDRMREGMGFLARRHEILRTTFDEMDGQPAQIVHPAEPVSLPLIDLAGEADAEERAAEIFRSEARRPFDLAKRPLSRLSLVRIRDGEHWLLRVSHHILSDALSWRIYLRELGELYEAGLRGEAPPLAELAPLQYGDYARWQRSALDPEGPIHREALAWWKDRLAGDPPAPALPFLRPRPEPADPADGILCWGLDASISSALARLAREEGATYYTLRLAAFAALLAVESQEEDVVLGTYVTNRNRLEWQSMLGHFANLVTLRLRFDPSLGLRAWLASVRKSVGDARARALLPYESLCAELRARGVVPPEIRAIFQVSDQTAPMRFGGCELTWFERRFEVMPWGFTLCFDRYREDRFCRASFDARLYDPAGVRRFTDRLVRLLGAIASRPDASVGTLLAN